MTTSRETLNELKWSRHALERALITYRHRGAPHDERMVAGRDIVHLGRSFFEISSAGPLPGLIPYHRVLAIELDGARIWERAAAADAHG